MDQSFAANHKSGATDADNDSQFVADLILYLRERGYAADTRHAVACENLLRGLGRGENPAAHDRVALLGPLFCRTPDEQRQFRGVFESFLELRRGLGNQPGKATRRQDVTSTGQPESEVTTPYGTLRRLALWAGSSIVVLGLFVAVVAYQRPEILPGVVSRLSEGLGKGSEEGDPSPPPITPGSEQEMASAGEQVGMLSYRRILVRKPDRRMSAWVWAAVTLPLLVASAWIARRWLTVPRLRRETTPLPESLKQVMVPGGVRNAFSHLGVRELGRALRVRQSVPSRELNVDASIQKTTRNGGLPALVFESRAEPAYLMFVDRRGGCDHFSRLVDSLLESLLQANVMVEVFSYDGDPTLCDTDARFAPRSRVVAARMPLSDLLNRWPERQIVFVGDGVEFCHRFSGEPAGWIKSLGDRRRVLVTPTLGEAGIHAHPPQGWSSRLISQMTVRESRLQRLGFQIIPLTQAGLRELPAALGFREMNHGAESRDLYSFEREPLRCVSRFKPPNEFQQNLVNELRKYLGPQGFLWLAAVAAYPEIHYGLTLRLGASLIPDESQWEALLPRLSHLIWLRRGFMPDWFRERLLERLETPQVKQVQEVLDRLFEKADQESGNGGIGPDAVPLRIAVDPPRTLRERIVHWWQRRRAAQRESERQAGDFVYLRFLSRGSGWLEPFVNRRLLQLLFPQGIGLLGPRPLSVVALGAAVSLAAYGGAFWWHARGLRIESITMNAGGQQIATTHPGGVTRIWSGLGPTLVATLGQEDGVATNDIRSVKMGPTGETLLLWTHDAVIFWNRVTGKSWTWKWTIGSRGALQWQSAFSADGLTCVVAVSSPGASQCWMSTESGSSESFNVPNIEAAWDLALSADGQSVVVADRRRVVEFNPRTNKVVAEFVAPEGLDFEQLIETEDKSWIAGRTKGAFELWEWRRGARHSSYSLRASEQENFVPSAEGQFVVSADGSVVIDRLNDHDLKIWDIATNQLLKFGGQEKSVFPPYTSWVTSDGQSYVTKDQTGALRWWDAKTAKLIGSPVRPNYDSMFAGLLPLAEHPPWLIQLQPSGGLLWNVENGTPFGVELPGMTLYSESTNSISADGNWLASAEGDRVMVWSLKEDGAAPSFSTTGSLSGISEDGRRAAISHGDGRVTIRSLTDANRELGSKTSNPPGVVAMLTPDGSEIARMSDLGRFEWLDVEAGATREDGANTVGGATDGLLGAVWGVNGSLLRWNSRMALLSHPDKQPEEFGLDWSANRHVSSTSRRYVLLWSDQLTPGKAMLIDTLVESRVLIPWSSGRIVGAAFSPDEQRLTCWNDGGDVEIYGVSPQESSTVSLVGKTSVSKAPPRFVGLSRGGTTLVVLDSEGKLSFHEVSPTPNNNVSTELDQSRPFRTWSGIASVAQGTGEVLAVVDIQGCVRLVDARAGTPLSDFLPASSRVAHATFGMPAGGQIVERPVTNPQPSPPPRSISPQPAEAIRTKQGPTPPGIDPPKSDDQPGNIRKQKAFYSPRAGETVGESAFALRREETSYVAMQSAPDASRQDDLPDAPPSDDNAKSAESSSGKSAYRETLALALDNGSVELWQIDLAGRGAALIVVGSQNGVRADDDLADRELRRTAALLSRRYGFEAELLIRPSREELATSMARLESRLTPDDRLVVVLAGLGDRSENQYRFAAGPKNEDLLSGDEIRGFLDRAWARQSLLIVDSSYAGMLLAPDGSVASSAEPARAVKGLVSSVDRSPRGTRARVVITASGAEDHSWADGKASKLITPLNRLLESDSGLFAGPFSSREFFELLAQELKANEEPTANGPIFMGRMSNVASSPQAEFYFPAPARSSQPKVEKKPEATY